MIGYATSPAAGLGAMPAYQVVLNAETQPMLQAHPRNFHGSRHNGQHWFYYFITKLTSLLGVVALAMSIVWCSIMLFDDKATRNVYQTTTFLTTIDKTNIDSWQVLTQTMNGGSTLNAPVDVQFNHYFDCWWRSRMVWGQCNNSTLADYKTCVTSKYSTQLNRCANTTDPAYVAPTLNAYSKCINDVFLPDRQTAGAMQICLRTNVWPLYESPQSVDTWYFLGSYNWMVLLTIGFGMFSCFAVYTGGFVISAETMDVHEGSHSKPARNGPLSYTVTLVCAVFAIVFFVYFLVNAYRLPNSTVLGSAYQFPNSIATNTIMIPVTLIVAVYFIAEFVAMWNTSDVKTMIHRMTQEQQLMAGAAAQPGKILQANGMPHRIGFEHGPGGESERAWRETITAYFPALTLSWADAYVLDAVIAVGLIGATQQVHTTTIYQIFVAIFAYRMAHTAVARLLYEGYIYNPDENDGKFNRENHSARDELFSIRIQAMFMHLSAVACVVILWFIMTNSNFMLSEFTLVTVMLYVWYVIPELIRLIAHIVVAFEAVGKSDKDTLMTINYCIWIWDVLARIIFIIIVFWGSNEIKGTQYFLKDKLELITSNVAYFAS